LLLALLLAMRCSAATWNDFVSSVHAVETGGRLGPILGDHGRSLGPLQISRAYWHDSGVGGKYENVADLQFATKTMRAYLLRYASHALNSGDWETCARVHNGGPRGMQKNETLPYWNKIKKHLTTARHSDNLIP